VKRTVLDEARITLCSMAFVRRTNHSRGEGHCESYSGCRRYYWCYCNFDSFYGVRRDFDKYLGKTDMLEYYKKLKKTWIYKIPWNTVLKENELGIS